MSGYMDHFRQSFFIPTPTLTEKNIPNQAGRVHIVTGGYTGVGLELCKTLYAANATVYVAGRSPEKATKGISAIKQESPTSKGRVEFLQIDLSDLTTIKPAAEEFLSKENRLDVLTQNAGVMMTPTLSKSAQGYELQMATNCIGPFLFAELLVPILKKTAQSSPPGSVRVTWAGSLAVDLMSPTGGITFAEPSPDGSGGSPTVHSNSGTNYGQTKAGNALLASEFTKRYPYAESKIISNSWNPGNLRSELQRHMGLVAAPMNALLCYEPRFGGYTELFAALSEEAGREENNGRFIWPWGRMGTAKQDVLDSFRSKQEGGSGKAAEFWDWCESETRKFT